MDRQTASAIMDILSRLYPDAACGLEFASPFELLVATVLSAQCTDVRVNAVTPALFSDAPTPAAMLELGEEGLISHIRSCGLYRVKSKNIIRLCRTLETDYGGNVPSDEKSLMSLPGVGRKVADVVLAAAFGQDVTAVDTHVFRVANRLGLAASRTPEGTRAALAAILEPGTRILAHYLLITHGRRVCRARKPACPECALCTLCAHAEVVTDKQA